MTAPTIIINKQNSNQKLPTTTMESYFACQITDMVKVAEQQTQQEMDRIVKAPNANKPQQIAQSSKAMRKQLQKHPSFLDAMKAASLAATEAVAPAL